MADVSSDETLRQLLSGFTTMQSRLGLLPMQQAQAMAGAGSQFQAPPPPPPMVHPADAAVAAMQQQQMMIQQTLQAAQVTRYQPPPSAAVPSVGAMAGFGMMNPFAPSAMGGGGSFAGGGGGGPGGGFTPMGAGRFPSVFNPFAPTLPQSHFAPPAMRNLQMMQHHQSQMLGAVSGLGEMAAGMGGSSIGGAIGSLFGPLGSIAGSFLGNKIGGAISNMIFNPAVQDIARGAQIQGMTAGYMSTGSFLNPMTGQGMSRQGGLQTATGIRHLQRDYDFERTGFNTQDTMKIMQMSADNGLLTGANSPDQLVQKVKDISKMVKSLVRMGGDPDVQSAIRDLGQMRDLGFQGLGAQGGALANRMSFARGAGVSQATMNAIGMGGAQMAGQFGLAGATGYNASMAGAAYANVGASSGALNDLQLSRAGGRQGLGQLITQGSLAAMDNDYALLASGRVGKGGKLEVDIDAYRRTQKMSFDEQIRAAAETTRELRTHGIMDWSTRKQEMKDQLAQQMKPGEMESNMLNQALALKAKFSGQMTLGVALQKVTGESAEQAQSLAGMYSSRKYWDGRIQQLGAQQHDVIDRDRAQAAQYRTPGEMTREFHNLRGTIGDIADTLSSPFARLSNHMARVAEDREAANYGQYIVRTSDLNIAHNDDERAMMHKAGQSKSIRRLLRQGTGTGMNVLDSSKDQSMFDSGLHDLASGFGLSSDNSSQMVRRLSNEMTGHFMGWNMWGSYGDTEDAVKNVRGAVQVGHAMNNIGGFTADQRSQMIGGLRSTAGQTETGKNTNIESIMNAATPLLSSMVNSRTAGHGVEADAIRASDLRSVFVTAAIQKGVSLADAARMYDEHAESINTEFAKTGMATGTDKQKEVWLKTKDIGLKAGAINRVGSSSAIADKMHFDLNLVGGLDDDDKETMGKVKAVFAGHSDDEIAVAAALASGDSKALDNLQKKYGDDKFSKLKSSASDLLGREDEKTKGQIGQMVKGGGDVEGVVSTVREGWGAGMTGTAFDALKHRIGEINPDAAGKDDILDVVGGLSASDLETLKKTDPDMAAKLEAIQKEKDSDKKMDLAQSLAEDIPTAAETAYGGTRALDKDRADLIKKRDELAGGDDSPGTVAEAQADAAQTFADGVKAFVDAVTVFKGTGQKSELDAAHPFLTALAGMGL